MTSPEFDKSNIARNVQKAYPARNGEELTQRLPLPKGKVLVIDDHADDEKSVIKVLNNTEILYSSSITLPAAENEVTSPSGLPVTLSNIYHFEPLSLSANDLKSSRGSRYGAAAVLRDRLDALGDLRRFDLILLDLCLGEKHGDDPTGYQLLPQLRKFFPLIPIVAYTKYRDMGHIERAFRRGATWFLPKDETEKLPSHHLEMIENPHWRREWNGIKDQLEWDLPVGAQFRDCELHLIWKCIEHMPGGRVLVRELSGGIGGARTLHVSREINGRYDRSAPVVIKIAKKFDMLLERERYQRFIQPYLSNLAGRIDVPLHVSGNNLGAIAYTYAGMSQGRRGGRKDILTLENLLQLNLPATHQEILDASRYERLFQSLAEDILQRIHAIDPRNEPSEIDFPNMVLGESPLPMRRKVHRKSSSSPARSGSPLDAYMMRMPADLVIPLDRPLVTSTEGDDDTATVYVYEIELGNRESKEAFIRGLASMEDDGLLHRVDLKGLLGSFYADHRHLRPMQPLRIDQAVEEIKGTANKHFESAWERLWGEKDALQEEARRKLTGQEKPDGSCLTFTFPKSDFNQWAQNHDPSSFAKATLNLYCWLRKKDGRARKALEQGRIGIVHGDMNLGNVMVERERGGFPDPVNAAPWLIDFARTRRDWIVQDFTQLELDLCMKLVRPQFFALGNAKPPQDWSAVDDFVRYFLETPWQEPAFLKNDERLAFVYRLMRMVRQGADQAGVRDEEYLASRVWQCLIAHKILCGKWRKRRDATNDPALQFRCVWSLRQAFQTAALLGWNTATNHP